MQTPQYSIQIDMVLEIACPRLHMACPDDGQCHIQILPENRSNELVIRQAQELSVTIAAQHGPSSPQIFFPEGSV